MFKPRKNTVLFALLALVALASSQDLMENSADSSTASAGNLRSLQYRYRGSCANCLGRPVSDRCWQTCTRGPAVTEQACENYVDTAKRHLCRQKCRPATGYSTVETFITQRQCTNYCEQNVANTWCGLYERSCRETLTYQDARICRA
uniref:ShKT domain-containing protein n=1 Tax=Chromera velia CCMP2878 TaxID=1169474 RepID=A0A0G4GQF3_9ALVE|mmetsp:Transcript_15300/g.31018  ORF Transcript_15300/g.31018 Transcript_15300/m.31018 type:complete len:147 (-) Transcript_15300:762-1202(-)|eukprot:Cvel_22917.t1-p1 / transcript=Cvel_22917.t1 / gene=Cvel_22917 / organism=Chromera_velia_CCMP2878 / gene_product=hypothetical protein / transcript_product=hypothetical protein / location=Cvel_scaffold2303:22457-22894(+) / protein_length=146 / sequence_SO=supercontig / SO=protein_coding / is_pseudo=false